LDVSGGFLSIKAIFVMVDTNAMVRHLKGLLTTLLERTNIGMFMASELMKSSPSIKC